MRRVLLLEDDTNLGLVLQEHLQMNGFNVTLCNNGEDGMTAFTQGIFDLCLVDIMMPKKDGFTFAREVRNKDQQVPLIFLTAKAMKEDKITGFRIGCDDYLTKPFSIEELLLRIEAVLRRSSATALAPDSTHFEIGRYTFDYQRQILRHGTAEVKLTPTESELLRLLCINLNRILDRDKALRDIWGNENYFTGRSMDVFISKLRKYLKDDPGVEIVSIHGKGYKLVVSADGPAVP
ncbi:DNA-binding response regulator [candidate division GN15 bacterium]|uniref:DNA-binding response regulator n=1 Tax=candidate division GN15 bacterium TaxID=2072418 RepID=A0A855X2M3_9BACT|nr:MAG: DNA-binding response regulator [candidate division GN15 bacterium]